MEPIFKPFIAPPEKLDAVKADLASIQEQVSLMVADLVEKHGLGDCPSFSRSVLEATSEGRRRFVFSTHFRLEAAEA